MEVVVSTPHGHADVDIAAAPADATLADLLRAVTGQAVPPTARVDGRVTATSERLADLDLCIGATIDTNAGDPYDELQRNEVVRLVQLTGRGAGRVVPLAPGRHRLGSSRRLHAGELERASVETQAFELTVGVDGATRVAPAPGSIPHPARSIGVYTPMLGDSPLDRELPWTGGRLSIAGRIFELDVPRPSDLPARRTKPAADGTLPFQRRDDAAVAVRRTTVDAVLDARRRSSGLWRRRHNDPDAFRLGYGIRPDGADAVVDISRHRGTALVGADRFTLAVARTLLLEAVTLHGPADLNVVIATVPERVTFWNWAKWLPHVRRGDPTSTPDLLVAADAQARWAAATASAHAPSSTDESATHPSHAGWAPPTAPHAARTDVGPLTLLVLDDVDLWSRRESPLQRLLAAPPPDLRFLALCSDIDEVPGRATAVIEEVPPAVHDADLARGFGSLRPALFGSLARQHGRHADDSSVVTDVRPALTEAELAVRAARRLAPLDDLDAIRRAPTPVHPVAPLLDELVDDATGPGFNVAVGALIPEPSSAPAPYTPAMVDLANSGPFALVCPDQRRRGDTVTAMVLGAASRHSPAHLAVLSLGASPTSWQADLPHLAGWTDLGDDPARVVHRITHVTKEHPDLHVLVLIDGAFEPPVSPRSELVESFLALSESIDNVHLLATASDQDLVSTARRTRFGTVVSIDANGRGVLDDGLVSTDFIAVGPPGRSDHRVSDRTPLVVHTTTHERAMTPLERRLARFDAQESAPDPDDIAVASIARRIASRFVGTDDADAASWVTAMSLLPPPLPDDAGFEQLLARFPGDALPLGLVDRPEHAENEAYWWQPGSGGSILAVGSPRAGLTALLDLLLAGIAARVSADDLHVYAIDGLPQRRRALESLPHVGGVVAPDDSMSVEDLVDQLHAILVQRIADRGDTDRPDIVLLVGDVGRVRRSMPPERVDGVFDRLAEIAATGAAVGVNVVAVGARAEDLGALTRLSGDRLVGDVADASDRSRLGVPEPRVGDRRTRRCWSTASERLVQLATPPDSIEAAIAAVDPEPATRQRPVTLPVRMAT